MGVPHSGMLYFTCLVRQNTLLSHCPCPFMFILGTGKSEWKLEISWRVTWRWISIQSRQDAKNMQTASLAEKRKEPNEKSSLRVYGVVTKCNEDFFSYFDAVLFRLGKWKGSCSFSFVCPLFVGKCISVSAEQSHLGSCECLSIEVISTLSFTEPNKWSQKFNWSGPAASSNDHRNLEHKHTIRFHWWKQLPGTYKTNRCTMTHIYVVKQSHKSEKIQKTTYYTTSCL